MEGCLDLGARSVVAIAGAGGKTTLMWRLASRLAARGERVAATTTTRVRAGEEPPGTQLVAWQGGDAPGLDDALDSGRVPLVVSGRTSGAKLLGISPDEADALSERVDHLIVEADGARGLPLKIPRPGEPVVPFSTTHLVVVAGLEGVGRPAGPDTLLGAEGLVPRGAILDPPLVRSLLLGPLGYLPHVERAPLAYLVVAGDDLDRGLALADALWHPALAGAIAFSASTGEAIRASNAALRVVGIVLGAGASERFGSPKLVAEICGRSLVRLSLEAALGSGLPLVCLVTGADSEAVERAAGPALSDPRVDVARNPDPRRGLSSSLKVGLSRVRDRADAIMILLADMPAVDAGLASSVLLAFTSGAPQVAATLVEGRTGHPVILRSDLFDEIDRLEGDAGARPIVDACIDRAALVPLADPSSQRDVDAPADLERLTRGTRS